MRSLITKQTTGSVFLSKKNKIPKFSGSGPNFLTHFEIRANFGPGGPVLERVVLGNFPDRSFLIKLHADHDAVNFFEI